VAAWISIAAHEAGPCSSVVRSPCALCACLAAAALPPPPDVRTPDLLDAGAASPFSPRATTLVVVALGSPRAPPPGSLTAIH